MLFVDAVFVNTPSFTKERLGACAYTVTFPVHAAPAAMVRAVPVPFKYA